MGLGCGLLGIGGLVVEGMSSVLVCGMRGLLPGIWGAVDTYEEFCLQGFMVLFAGVLGLASKAQPSLRWQLQRSTGEVADDVLVANLQVVVMVVVVMMITKKVTNKIIVTQ